MDVKELSDKKKALDLQIAADIRGFEMETGMQATGIRINRDEEGIESITVKVEMP